MFVEIARAALSIFIWCFVPFTVFGSEIMYVHDTGFLAITEATISINFHLLLCQLDLTECLLGPLSNFHTAF